MIPKMHNRRPLRIAVALTALLATACPAPVKQQPPYPGIAATLLDSQLLDVYLMEDGDYVIDLFDWNGTRVYPPVPGTRVRASTPALLYERPGTVTRLDILDDGTVRFILDDAAGIFEFAVSRNGMTVELDTAGGSKQFVIHFMDVTTGGYSCSGVVVEGVSTCTFHYKDVALPDIPITYSLNDDEDIGTYRFTGFITMRY